MNESNLPPAAGGTPELDRLPPPTVEPVAVPAAPVPPPRPSMSPSSALIGGGIVIVALAAAAGGVIWMPRDGDVDHASAVARGLIGAGAGLLVATIAVLAMRRSGWWRRIGIGTAALAAIVTVAVALGAMLGAATARSADPEVARPDVDEPAPQPDGDGSGGTGGGMPGGPGLLSEHAEASLVDADGDGRPDVDADGNLIVAFDADGDGFFEGRLIPCPRPDDSGDNSPSGDDRLDADDVDGGIRLDFTCDGSTDRLIQLSPSMLRSIPSEGLDEGSLSNDLDGNGIPDGWELGGVPGAGLDPDRDEAGSPGVDDGPNEPDDDNNDNDNDNSEDDDKSDIGKTVLYLLLTLLIAGAGAALAWGIVQFARRDRSRPAERPAEDSDAEPETVDDQAAEAAIEESIETLLGHPDPRLGIRAAYAVLLDALSEAGFARRSFEAPEEHLERCLHGLQIEPGPLRELLRLFAIARYSTHEITERERSEALDALRRSQDLLRRRQALAAVPAGAGPMLPPQAPGTPSRP